MLLRAKHIQNAGGAASTVTRFAYTAMKCNVLWNVLERGSVSDCVVSVLTCWPYMLGGLCSGVRLDAPVASDALGVSALLPACCTTQVNRQW